MALACCFLLPRFVLNWRAAPSGTSQPSDFGRSIGDPHAAQSARTGKAISRSLGFHTWVRCLSISVMSAMPRLPSVSPTRISVYTDSESDVSRPRYAPAVSRCCCNSLTEGHGDARSLQSPARRQYLRSADETSRLSVRGLRAHAWAQVVFSKAPSSRRQCCRRLTSISLIGVLPAMAAAVPAACPITKQAPLARAADWPSCVIEAHRPATKRLSTTAGRIIRQGNSL